MHSAGRVNTPCGETLQHRLPPDAAAFGVRDDHLFDCVSTLGGKVARGTADDYHVRRVQPWLSLPSIMANIASINTQINIGN